MTRQWVLDLPWTAPPLSMNDRDKWQVKAAKTAKVRAAVSWIVRAEVPPLDRCDVVLTYHPRDKRRRDEDNLVATLKVACDAIVTAGVVRDDTPDLMVKHMPVIGPVVKGGRITLTITELDPTEGDADDSACA